MGSQQTKEQKELLTREREGQGATKITSARAESCIQFLFVSDADFDDSADVDGEEHP